MEVVYECSKKDSIPLLIIKYDTGGNVIKKSFYVNRELNEEDTFMLNDKGQMIRIFSYKYGTKRWYNDEFEYDSVGNQVMHLNYNQDTTQVIVEREIYNNKNQLIELRVKQNKGDFYSLNKYYYNQQGNLEKKDLFDHNEEIIYSLLYEYNDAEKIIALYRQNSSSTEKIEVYTYNGIHQLIKEEKLFDHSILSNTPPNLLLENFEDDFIYNADGTIFQWTGKSRQGKSVKRHYYRYY